MCVGADGSRSGVDALTRRHTFRCSAMGRLQIYFATKHPIETKRTATDSTARTLLSIGLKWTNLASFPGHAGYRTGIQEASLVGSLDQCQFSVWQFAR